MMMKRIQLFALACFAAVMLVSASPRTASAQKTKPPVTPPPITYKITFVDAATTLWDINEKTGDA